MAGLGRIGAALKALWAEQPVLSVSIGIAALAVISPFISPYAEYSGMINRATPYRYPVPLRDDGSLPSVPSHPCDPEGPNLEWLKRL